MSREFQSFDTRKQYRLGSNDSSWNHSRPGQREVGRARRCSQGQKLFKAEREGVGKIAWLLPRSPSITHQYLSLAEPSWKPAHLGACETEPAEVSHLVYETELDRMRCEAECKRAQTNIVADAPVWGCLSLHGGAGGRRSWVFFGSHLLFTAIVHFLIQCFLVFPWGIIVATFLNFEIHRQICCL